MIQNWIGCIIQYVHWKLVFIDKNTLRLVNFCYVDQYKSLTISFQPPSILPTVMHILKILSSWTKNYLTKFWLWLGKAIGYNLWKNYPNLDVFTRISGILNYKSGISPEFEDIFKSQNMTSDRPLQQGLTYPYP